MVRIFDIFFSSIALLVLSPIFLICILFLSVSGEREVFFKQKRMGKNGKMFYLYKFATMLKNSPNMSTGTITVKDDPRILPFGGILRKTKINELPQLINVLIGDMSIVGPRPLTAETFSFYPSITQNIIKKVRPGLSGIGSIIFRHEESILQGKSGSISYYKDIIAPYKGDLEIWFTNKNSIKLYFITIMITIWVVLFPNSGLAWKLYDELPVPPKEIMKQLNYYK